MRDLNTLTIAELTKLDSREYTNAMRMCLRTDVLWQRFLDPALEGRTWFNLTRLIASIDAQQARAVLETEKDRLWLRGIMSLQRWARERLDVMPARVELPTSGTKEARAWRALSAMLADELRIAAPEALDRLKAPYGGLTVNEWMTARENKKEGTR